MDDRWLLIRHADGREYAVLPALFHAQYEPEGFVVVSYVDGAPYLPPKRKPSATKEMAGDEG